MIENEFFLNSKIDNSFLTSFNSSLNFSSLLYQKEDIKLNLVNCLSHSPQLVLFLLDNHKLNTQEIEEDILVKIFSSCCNMLKEIERETKIIGLKILNYIWHRLPQDSFMNAYVFEKELAKAFNPIKSKLVSIGDYEMTKFDSELATNFGFFAAALEEEKKIIKILTLNLISKIGASTQMKDFALISFKYVIELVNDEEDEVRYETIKCLESLIINFKKIEVSE
jgi:hypothetical protein